MADFELSIHGLDELKADFQKCVSKYPDQTVKEVYRLAGVWTKDVNAKMVFEKQSRGKRHPTDEWHRERVAAAGAGYTVAVDVRNKAPHWHLIENGHVSVKDPQMYAAYKAGRLDASKGSGRKAKSRSKNSRLVAKGSAKPRHWAMQTRMEWETKFPAYIRKYADKMLKENNL